MYSLLHDLFSDKTGGEVFTCFSFWHFLYVFLVIATIAIAILVLRKRDADARNRALRFFVAIPFVLYMADFFLMPFAYGEIDVDKLPFHSCTVLCLLCFLSNHNRVLYKYRLHFAMMACLSNLMYLAYPAGVMWYEIHPLSYRAVQTLLFHGYMVVYGFLALVWNWRSLQLRHCYRDLALLGCMTVWAILGNALYSGAADGYDRHFNWFFVRSDPFGLLSEEIALYIAPWLNIAAFFSLEILIYLAIGLIRKKYANTAVDA